MTNESAYISRFNAVLKKVLKAHAEQPPEPAEPITQLIHAFLQWNATQRQAELAYSRVMEAMVDANDLRISFVDEVIGLLGPRYPMVDERAARLHDALQEVFVREHGMTLTSLATKPKKDARTYLDSLPGMTPFVAAQVMLLCFGAHAVPVDDRLNDLLREAGAIDEDATPAETEAFIGRRIKSGEAPQVHAALQAWVDAGSKRVKVATTKKKTSKKTTAARTKKKVIKKKK